jgi:hypothetical protein
VITSYSVTVLKKLVECIIHEYSISIADLNTMMIYNVLKKNLCKFTGEKWIYDYA